MQMRRLRLTNFRQHEATDLNFADGLIGIVGVNGAGKTTLLEAIGFALYGQDAARGKRDSVKRRGAPPKARCEVDLIFTLAGRTWQVTRTLTMAELRIDEQPVANSLSAVTEWVTRGLGMNRQEFFNTYFTRQKDLDAMAADMSASERSRFLSRVLQYEKLRSAQEQLRKDRSRYRADLSGLEKGLQDPEELRQELARLRQELQHEEAARAVAQAEHARALEHAEELKPVWLTAQQQRQRWEALDQARRQQEQEVAATESRYQVQNDAWQQASQAAAEVQRLEQELSGWPELSEELTSLDALALEWTRRSQEAAQREEAGRRLSEVDLQLGQLPEPAADRLLAEQIAATQNLIRTTQTDLTDRRDEWTRSRQENQTELEKYRREYEEIREQRSIIREAGEEGKCPTCQRPLGAEAARALIERFTRQLEDLQVSGTYVSQRVEELKSPPQRLVELEQQGQAGESRLRQLLKEQGTLREKLRQRSELLRLRERLQLSLSQQGEAAELPSYDSARHQALRQTLQVLEPLKHQQQRAAGLAASVPALLQQVEETRQKLQIIQAELTRLDAELAALNWDAVRFQELDRQVREAEQRSQQQLSELQIADGRVANVTRVLARVVSEQQRQLELAADAQKVRQQISALDELDRAFTDLINQLNGEIRPDLSLRASRLLDRLTRGRYTDLELDEAYLPQVMDGGEAKPVLSGGEEDVVNLAMRLAISQMIAERSGQPLSMLVLDEVFGSLDEDRRDGVLDMLRALADEFPQVILITHVEGMQEAFDRVIRVVHDVKTGVSSAHDEVLTGDLAI